MTVRPSGARLVRLTVVEPDAVTLGGRVIGTAGRGIAGSSVRIWSILRSPSGSVEASMPVRFDGADELKTGPDGRFQTTRTPRPDREALAVAAVGGHTPGGTRPRRPG